MRIDVITLFPAVFPGPLGESIPGRVLERGLAEIEARWVVVAAGAAWRRRSWMRRNRAAR